MKRLLLASLLTIAVAGLGFSFQAGTGISVYIPESLYLHDKGSVAVENNLQTSLSLSKCLSLPFGVTWDKVDGYTPGGTAALDAVSTPWFFGDSVMGYVMARVHLPVSIFFLNIEGGGALNWNATLTPIGQAIESYLTPSGSLGVAFPNPTYSAPWGYGWVAGASLGVALKKFSVSVAALYRDIRSPLKLSGTYYTVGPSGTTSTQVASYSLPTGAVAVMRGISVGINGDFKF